MLMSSTRMSESLNATNVDGERFINVATVCFIGIILTIGLVGNSLVLYIYAYRFKASPFNIFIIFLAVMDFIFCVLDMPLEIANMTYHTEFGGCKFATTLGTVTSVSTGLCLIAIAALRFNAVCRPLKQTISNKTARCLNVVFFLTACAVSWPAAVLLTNVHLSLGEGVYVTNCATSPEYVDTDYPLIYSVFQYLLFLGAFFSISVLYCLTGSRLRKRKKYGIACRSTEFTSSTSSEKYSEPVKTNITECKSTDTIFSICEDGPKSPDRIKSIKSNRLQSNVSNQNLTQVQSNAESQNLYDLNQLSAMNVLEQSKCLTSSAVTFQTNQSKQSSCNIESNMKSTYHLSCDGSNTKETDQSSHDESNSLTHSSSSESDMQETDQSRSGKSNNIHTDQSRNTESKDSKNKFSCIESNTKETDHSKCMESNNSNEPLSCGASNTFRTDQSRGIESNNSNDQSSHYESNQIRTDESSHEQSNQMSKIQSNLIRSNSLPSHQSKSIISDPFSSLQSKGGYASFRKLSSNCSNQSKSLMQLGHHEQTSIEYDNPIYYECSVTNIDDSNRSESLTSVGVQRSGNPNQSSFDQSNQIDPNEFSSSRPISFLVQSAEIRNQSTLDESIQLNENKSKTPSTAGVQSVENLNQSSFDESNQIDPNESSGRVQSSEIGNQSSFDECNQIDQNERRSLSSVQSVENLNQSSLDEFNQLNQNESRSSSSVGIQSSENLNQPNLDEFNQDHNEFSSSGPICFVVQSSEIRNQSSLDASNQDQNERTSPRPISVGVQGSEIRNQPNFDECNQDHNELSSSRPISFVVKSAEIRNQSSLDVSNQDQLLIRSPDSDIPYNDSDRSLKESCKNHKTVQKRVSIITGSNKLDPVKMLVIMALIFFLSYVPHLSLRTYIELSGSALKLVPVSESIIGIIIRSYFLGSVCNPILYGCYNRKFREEVKSIWKTFKNRFNR